MSRQGLIGTAIGIIIATSILSWSFYFTDSKQEVTKKDVQAYLKQHDAVMVDSKKYDQLLSLKEQRLQTQADQSKQATKETNQGQVYTTTLNVAQGMTPEDVATILEQAKVVQNHQDLLQYLRDHQLEPYLQLGTYELNSSMSIEQIAQIIATPKK